MRTDLEHSPPGLKVNADLRSSVNECQKSNESATAGQEVKE